MLRVIKPFGKDFNSGVKRQLKSYIVFGEIIPEQIFGSS